MQVQLAVDSAFDAASVQSPIHQPRTWREFACNFPSGMREPWKTTWTPTRSDRCWCSAGKFKALK
eukprot:CAMPEP_0172773778 /NCGR_PEP_ID=MMETSP1074-20121228/194901_1 /TAXON_ID=2916 /ORGANISM="Ceratium fusus, Strain PA161109" /LENGTH=64 /DNA_ID=CAMNT_0013610105 /DNA_START=254 /DNA_END=448 /DNA_ORIENTATION=+